MALINQSFSIDNKGNSIHGDIRYPDDKVNLPLVIVIHGFKAWKDWGFYPYICSRIALSGAICINYSSSHCGVSPGSDFIDKPNLFACNTPLIEIEDYQKVISEFATSGSYSNIRHSWNGELILVGHSRGAAISLIIASTNKSVIKVVAWCPINNFIRWTDRQISKWKDSGKLEFMDNKTGYVLWIDNSYLNTIYQYSDFLNPESRVAELTIPVCFVHGQDDLTVNYKESENIFRNVTNPDSEYHLIDGTGHTFGVNHPFENTNSKLEEVLNYSINFIYKK